MERRYRGGILFPLLIVALGVVLLLNNLGLTDWDAWDALARLWPLLIVAMGLDMLLQRAGWVTPLLLIVLGVAILLSTTGTQPWDYVGAALAYWPLLIVAIGLDVIIGRPATIGPLVGVIPGLIMITIFAWLLGGIGLTERPTQTHSIAQEMAGAESAGIRLRPATGSLRLAGLEEPSMLVVGSVYLTEREELDESFSVSNDRAGYTLESRGLAFAPLGLVRDTTWRWDLRLAPGLPIDLEVETAAGNLELDLTGLDVRRLWADAAVGRTSVTLPAEGRLSGSIEGAIGLTEILVPRGRAVLIRVDRGLGTVSAPPDWRQEDSAYLSPGYDQATDRVELDIRQAIGTVRIRWAEE